MRFTRHVLPIENDGDHHAKCQQIADVSKSHGKSYIELRWLFQNGMNDLKPEMSRSFDFKNRRKRVKTGSFKQIDCSFQTELNISCMNPRQEF